MGRQNAGRFRRLIPLLFALASFLAEGCAGTPLSKRVITPFDALPASLVRDERLIQTTDDLALPLINDGTVAGVDIGIVFPDRTTVCLGYGTTGLPDEWSLPNEKTIYGVGSISKLMVLTLFCQLEQEGVLSGRETLRDILPGGTVLSQDAAQITLYELATHTAGFPRELRTRQQFHALIHYLFTGDNLYGFMNHAWLKEYLATCVLNRTPGRSPVYSNLGMSILAYMLELKTETPLPVLARNRIFRPLGMTDTGYRVPEEERFRLAAGHAGDQPFFIPRNAPLADWDMGALMRATGGLYSTPSDLLVFVQAAMGMTDSPLSAAFQRLRGLSPVRADNPYGSLGWHEWYDSTHDIRLLYVHGMAAGYSSYLGFCPDRQVAVVVLYNNFNWDDLVGGNLLLRAASGEHASGTRSGTFPCHPPVQGEPDP